uniref:Tail fiber protein n=1 Tax=Burkholderia phage vB_BgluM-SURPRISE13 TaxID=3159457 RepID=A0AAU7PHM8_9VIRU
MAFDLTKIAASMTALTQWVKDGLSKKADATATTNALASKANASDLSTTNQNLTNLATTVGQKADATATTNALAGKQSTILTGTAAPANTVGNDGDVFLVTDS